MDQPPRDVRGRIFISYRREDTAYPAGWLFDRLAERFGEDQLFKDIDSIELGDDFVEVIGEAVGSSDVLLALIGDKWLAIANEQGARRLDDPADFVRIEIESALQRKVRVIPILVEGARMPREEELPSSLMPLARRQALELSPARFSSDTTKLLKVIEKTLAEDAPPAAAPPRPTSPPKMPPKEETRETPVPDERAPGRARLLPAVLAFAGAGLGLAANALPTDKPVGSDPGFAPETLGVPVLVAVTAALLLAGRIREGLAYGLLLGFGLLTTAGAVGIAALSIELDVGHFGDAALALVPAGVLVLAAGIVGASRRSLTGSAGGPFRWGPASLLAVLGAVVAFAALFVPFGTFDDGSHVSVVQFGANDLTGLVIEPVVAILAACGVAYAVGKGGALGVLGAGAAIAIGAQTMLSYGSLIGAVASNYADAWKPGLGVGCFVGLGAGALFLAAGLVRRRPLPEPDLQAATTT